jgi:2-methylcitrate dehydratase
MAGFLGPRDIFRNPEAIFRIFEGPGQMFQKVGATGSANTAQEGRQPLRPPPVAGGSDFTVMGMHFKLGLYEHQSAGALQGLINLIEAPPHLLDDQSGDCIKSMVVRLRARLRHHRRPGQARSQDAPVRRPLDALPRVHDAAQGARLRAAKKAAKLGWKDLMLLPHDFDRRRATIRSPAHSWKRSTFEHGGAEYDAKYPDGIPTSVVITDRRRQRLRLGLVMYPGGHARNTSADLKGLLAHKFTLMGRLVSDNPEPIIARYSRLEAKSAGDIQSINDFALEVKGTFD